MTDFTPALTGNSRIFYQEGRAGPGNPPVYLGHGRSMGQDWPQGDETPLFLPSETSFGEFDVIGKIKGQRGLPSQGFQTRMPLTASEVLDLVRKGCPLDFYTIFGACKDPTDFDGGWTDGHLRVLSNGRITNYSTTDLGSFDGAENEITEDIPVTGEDLFQIHTIVAEEQAAAQITDPIIAVVICDKKTCGQCGVASDGCQVVFALTGGVAGSPGLPVELLYTSDGGDTWGDTNPTTMSITEVPTGMKCVGSNLVITSNAGDALHYAPIADILDGTEVWTKVTTGIVAAGSPNAIFSVSRTKTWVTGDLGYIYFSSDITSGLTPQISGAVTAQNLTAIDGIDGKNLIAVGASNAVVVTANGGDAWALVVGPAVGVALTSVSMMDKLTWLVGTADGKLYYTTNGGSTWTLKGFPGSGAGVVRALSFANRNVGYMAHDTAALVGRVLRTNNGGYSWYVLPEGEGFITPDNDRISAIDACPEDPNVVFAGGIGANASDGILLKFS